MLLSPPPKMQFLGDDGLPLSGGKVYTYAKGTTTPLVTYTDLGGVATNANPVILDPYGRATICFQQLSYTLVVHNSTDVLQGCSGDVEFPASVGGGESVEAYSDIVSYSFPDVVAGSDGYTYRCVGVSILGDDPVGSVTGNWVNLSPATLNSPAFTGIPTAPTAAAGTNTTQLATCAFVSTAISNGVVFASASEAAALASTTKIISPARLLSAFEEGNQLKEASGYQRLPGGVIIQWGNFTANGTGNWTQVNFPIAFTANHALIGQGVSTTQGQGAQLGKVSNSAFTYISSYAIPVSWLAIGY